MTEEELQELINFLVSELKILREGYNKLCTIYDTIHAKVEDDVDYYGVKHQLLDWDVELIDDEEQTGGTERKEREE